MTASVDFIFSCLCALSLAIDTALLPIIANSAEKFLPANRLIKQKSRFKMYGVYWSSYLT
jgi:hypothetical protein